MRTLFHFLLLTGAAQAHESLVPHQHPHGVSMLPDLDTLVVAAVLLIALGLLAYAKIGGR